MKIFLRTLIYQTTYYSILVILVGLESSQKKNQIKTANTVRLFSMTLLTTLLH